MTPFRLSLALLAVCAVAIWQVTLIPESLMQMAVGPTLVPK
ncbi:MAG: tripartite tricarboxylate transporter TctB family protein, partial [Betaproteobacteria bacterium]|nr:tripartite tricarboxylate transporter TctB family protein [Betaproteobacteria bacterium]